MPNRDLLIALENFQLQNKTLDPKARQAALNDLLKVDPSSEAAFKKAIASHKTFWDAVFPPGFAADDQVIPAIIQSVAEQSVLLNLPDTELEKIYTEKDPDKNREYLAKLQVNLTSAFQWGTDKTKVLTENSINRITAQAELLHKISQSNDLALLSAFEASRDEATALALGITPSMRPFLLDRTNKILLSSPVQEKLNAQLAALSLPGFKASIDGLSDAQIIEAGKKITDDTTLATYLGRHLNGKYLNKPISQEAKDYFLNRYLVSQVNTLDHDQLVDALKATDDDLKNQVDTSYAMKNLKNPWLYREMAFEKYFKDYNKPDIALLVRLSNHTNIDSFREDLKDLGIQAFQTIPEDSMQRIQSAARKRAIEIKTQGQRPALVDTFLKLPQDKQRELLSDEKKLDPVINGRTQTDIDSHLPGILPPDAQAIKKEKEGLDLFMSIHNPAVAKILADFRPPILLDAARVKKINDAFMHGAHPLKKLSEDANYKAFVDKLGDACGNKTDAFKEAFGIKGNDVDADIKDEITRQHKFNKPLLRWHATSPAAKSISTLLLNLSKSQAADIANVGSEFHGSAKVEDFAEQILGPFPDRFTQLTGQEDHARDTFEKIKHQERAERLARSEPQALVELRELAKDLHALETFPSDLARVSETKPMRVHYKLFPQFEKNNPWADEVEKDFKRREEECDALRNALYRKLAILNSYPDDLPADAKDEIKSQKVKAMLILDSYDELKARLMAINEAIRQAKSGMYHSVAQIQKFKIRLNAEEKPLAETKLTSLSMKGSKDEEELLLMPKLKSGEYRTYTQDDGWTVTETEDGFKLPAFPSPSDDPDNSQRVFKAMSAVIMVLSAANGPPTKDNPFIIECKNADEANHLWTAVMFLKDAHPNMSFNEDAIQCITPFDPNSQKSKMPGVTFNTNSLHDTVFLKSPVALQLRENFKEKMNIKFDPENRDIFLRKKGTVEAASRAVSGELKDGIKELREKEKKEKSLPDRPADAPEYKEFKR